MADEEWLNLHFPKGETPKQAATRAANEAFSKFKPVFAEAIRKFNSMEQSNASN